MEGDIYNRMNTYFHEVEGYKWRNESIREHVIYRILYTELSIKSAEELSNKLLMFGFTDYTNTLDIIKTMDKEGHSEITNFRTKADELKRELQYMTPAKPMNKERVKGVIEYFKSLPEKYTDSKYKAEQRIRYAAYYNLCKIYYYLDEPENVAQYADLLILNGYEVSDGAKLKNDADKIKAIFDKTGIRTRHYF
jgi:aspartyl/asparaginyl-tRNA synthetase